MKIAAAVCGTFSNAVISDLFGKSDYFFLSDTENNTEEIICNPFSKTFDGDGIQAAHLLVEKGIDVLLSDKIGLNARRIFNSAGIQIYRCTRESPETAIKSFIENRLLRL